MMKSVSFYIDLVQAKLGKRNRACDVSSQIALKIKLKEEGRMLTFRGEKVFKLKKNVSTRSG